MNVLQFLPGRFLAFEAPAFPFGGASWPKPGFSDHWGMSISSIFQKQKSFQFFHFNKFQMKPFLLLLPPRSEIRDHWDFLLMPIPSGFTAVLVKTELQRSVYAPSHFVPLIGSSAHEHTGSVSPTLHSVPYKTSSDWCVSWSPQQTTPTSPFFFTLFWRRSSDALLAVCFHFLSWVDCLYSELVINWTGRLSIRPWDATVAVLWRWPAVHMSLVRRRSRDGEVLKLVEQISAQK